jgi:hypothetical protein
MSIAHRRYFSSRGDIFLVQYIAPTMLTEVAYVGDRPRNEAFPFLSLPFPWDLGGG